MYRKSALSAALPEASHALRLDFPRIEGKPLKYPTIFNSADVAVLTKMDLADAVEFDEPTALANIQAVRPGMQVLQVSAKTGLGMKEFIDLLGSRRAGTQQMNVAT